MLTWMHSQDYLYHPEGYASDPAIFNISQMESLPVTAAELWKATAKDRILSLVFHYTKEGWPIQVEESLRSFWRKKKNAGGRVCAMTNLGSGV